MISAARHFAQDLRDEGFEVIYLKAETTKDGIIQTKKSQKITNVIAAEPHSFRLLEIFQTELAAEIDLIPTDFFLTAKSDFLIWATSQKSLLMENFYRAQRKRLSILMDGDKPVGGAWNYDKENRLPPPKQYVYPEYLQHHRDQIDQEVSNELKSSDLQLWGVEPDSTWATTRAGALNQLNNFLENHFAQPLLKYRLNSCQRSN
jgi:deoxyribodipyrimidine photolyase-related protein